LLTVSAGSAASKAEPQTQRTINAKTRRLKRPLVNGIIGVTPDSSMRFSAHCGDVRRRMRILFSGHRTDFTGRKWSSKGAVAQDLLDHVALKWVDEGDDLLRLIRAFGVM
jgi:hypothetical protein